MGALDLVRRDRRSPESVAHRSPTAYREAEENFGFARNALWALFQFHPWSDRREPFLALDINGEPLEKEYV